MTNVNAGNEILSRLMSAATMRDRILAENIANQNVPGYQRRVVSFEETLRARVLAGRGHADVEPKLSIDTATPAGPDGNNVSLELETNAMRENRLAYELYATILQSRMNMAMSAVSEGR